MAWVKVDDRFDEHPKLANLGPLGWGMWLAGLAYCNRNLTDGFIPWSKARSLASFDTLDDDGTVWGLKRHSGRSSTEVTAQWVIDLLVSAGLWVTTAGGYQIHDYDQYQPTRAQAEQEREQKARAGRAGGQASAQARSNQVDALPAAATQAERQAPAQAETEAGAQAGAQAETEAGAQAGAWAPASTIVEQVPKQNPTPVPVPVPSASEEADIARSKNSKIDRKRPAKRIDPDWWPDADLLAWCESSGYTLDDVQAQVPIFRDHFTAKGEARPDWGASFRNWMRRVKQFAPPRSSPGTTAAVNAPSTGHTSLDAFMTPVPDGFNPNLIAEYRYRQQLNMPLTERQQRALDDVDNWLRDRSSAAQPGSGTGGTGLAAD